MPFSEKRKSWEIVSSAGGREVLRFGRHVVPLEAIAKYESGSAAELNYDGHMLAIGMFMGAACLFVLPVVMAVLHPRFLAGGALFAGIGLMLISDVRQGHAMTLHRIRFDLVDGRSDVFATADISEAQSLIAALARRSVASGAITSQRAG